MCSKLVCCLRRGEECDELKILLFTYYLIYVYDNSVYIGIVLLSYRTLFCLLFARTFCHMLYCYIKQVDFVRRVPSVLSI